MPLSKSFSSRCKIRQLFGVEPLGTRPREKRVASACDSKKITNEAKRLLKTKEIVLSHIAIAKRLLKTKELFL